MFEIRDIEGNVLDIADTQTEAEQKVATEFQKGLIYDANTGHPVGKASLVSPNGQPLATEEPATEPVPEPTPAYVSPPVSFAAEEPPALPATDKMLELQRQMAELQQEELRKAERARAQRAAELMKAPDGEVAALAAQVLGGALDSPIQMLAVANSQETLDAATVIARRLLLAAQNVDLALVAAETPKPNPATAVVRRAEAPATATVATPAPVQQQPTQASLEGGLRPIVTQKGFQRSGGNGAPPQVFQNEFGELRDYSLEVNKQHNRRVLKRG